MLVLDSSVTLAWIYSDETTPQISNIFEQIAEDGAVVPSLWRLEVANGLQIGLRRNRIDAAMRDNALLNMEKLTIAIDKDTDMYAWTTTLRLAQKFALTLYDAAYLELAQRRALPLATLDRDLRAAASALGIGLLGLAD